MIRKGVYEIYNITKDKTGKHFTMCDSCYKAWKERLPNDLLVTKIAEKSLERCDQCDK